MTRGGVHTASREAPFFPVHFSSSWYGSALLFPLVDTASQSDGIKASKHAGEVVRTPAPLSGDLGLHGFSLGIVVCCHSQKSRMLGQSKSLNRPNRFIASVNGLFICMCVPCD